MASFFYCCWKDLPIGTCPVERPELCACQWSTTEWQVLTTPHDTQGNYFKYLRHDFYTRSLKWRDRSSPFHHMMYVSGFECCNPFVIKGCDKKHCLAELSTDERTKVDSAPWRCVSRVSKLGRKIWEMLGARTSEIKSATSPQKISCYSCRNY